MSPSILYTFSFFLISYASVSTAIIGGMDFVSTVRQSQFTKLWLAQVISQIAQNQLNFSLIIEVFNLAAKTHFANVSVGLVVLAFGVPSIFFSAAAGAYADHWNRKQVLVITNLLRTVLVLGYVFLDRKLDRHLASHLHHLLGSTQFLRAGRGRHHPQARLVQIPRDGQRALVFSLYPSGSSSAVLASRSGDRSALQ